MDIDLGMVSGIVAMTASSVWLTYLLLRRWGAKSTAYIGLTFAGALLNGLTWTLFLTVLSLGEGGGKVSGFVWFLFTTAIFTAFSLFSAFGATVIYACSSRRSK